MTNIYDAREKRKDLVDRQDWLIVAIMKRLTDQVKIIKTTLIN